jgi:hypothetical protein
VVSEVIGTMSGGAAGKYYVRRDNKIMWGLLLPVHKNRVTYNNLEMWEFTDEILHLKPAVTPGSVEQDPPPS